jgi:uncharacterized protein
LLSCWVVTDGKAGMESQCLGLAEGLGLAPVMKRVTLRPFWRTVTPYLRFGGRRQFSSSGDALMPPWPDLLIASGRQSVAAALWVKKASAGKTLLVQIQNPGRAWRHFDLIVAPEHDRLAGRNVISTRGSLHRVTQDLLARNSAQWSPAFAHLPRPFIAVLIGGSNAVYRLGPDEMIRLATKLVTCAGSLQGSLLITPSRRTAPDAIAALAPGLTGVPHYLWDMQGNNPYFGLLGLADFIVVTCDSVNMISEAASTGKPLYVEALPGGSVKSNRFLDALRDAGVVRDFAGALSPYAYTPPDDMTKVVERVRRLFRSEGLDISRTPGCAASLPPRERSFPCIIF